ncbi:MAG TPA: 30S ribosomal protein S6 [Candidatus Limnocylindria bacterium]|nr:30S ribosomal protein S6 [Candidatus Limnocylindria bacterium]
MPNRRYETLILIHPEQGEAGSKDVVTRIRQLAESQGAVISQVQEWGARELAYPIQRQRRAYHVLFEYRATPQALAEIERNLKLMEPVLRYLSVRQAENAPPAALRPTAGSEAPVAESAEAADEAGLLDEGEAAGIAEGEGA